MIQPYEILLPGKILDFARKRIELAQNEEHQAYKISKLLAQKTFFSHAFSRVGTRAVSRVIHKVGIAFLSGSIRSQKSSFHQFYN
jgi:hypothetical protein